MYTEKVITITEEMDAHIRSEILRIITVMKEAEGVMQLFYSAMLVGFTSTLSTLGVEEYELYLNELATKENEVQEQTEGEVQEQLGIDGSETA